ncbi:GNAT family N-acetyltransferase [Streptomyces sp. ACA25]|uniref:GNAT family N-acetyltransferase n=1 Tax=Streptomyces sp. ACA25 TaxID=3022596 RepID=UPI002307639C|nr:GNAT family N-acetyltransferase [Streptomyces sp. ACA25]MDB1086490.1 GNAT family N-acetyltransferase [Streptomyces sp. ACA25]
MAIKVLPVSGEQTDLLGAVVALGDRYTKWLGLLTPPAYRAAAEDGGLLVAVEGEEVVGYALFGLPKRSTHVRLAHLCVPEEHRGKGIARRLIQSLCERHPERLGIRARCRRDYDLSGMWTSLGFVPLGEGLGRGRDQATLDTWWLDFGHQDLFAEVKSDALLVVTVDHSVFAGLRGMGNASDVAESRALEAGWLADLIELAFTPQLLHDVRDVADRTARQHLRAGLPSLRQISPDPATVTSRHKQLLAAVEQKLPELSLDAKMRSRLKYVAETSCVGLQVLVTRDLALARLADIAWDVAGVRVVAPSVVTLHVDELRHAQLYRPKDLLGTAFSAGEVAPGGEGELVVFFGQADRDDGSAFEEQLKGFANDQVLWRRVLLRDGERRPVALYIWAMDGRELNIPLLRTATHPLEESLARQLLLMLKRLGRDHGAQAIRITDRSLSPATRAAAGADGFTEHSGDLITLLVDVCGSAAEVSGAAAGIAGRLGLAVPELHAGLPAEVASIAERAWWPAKIIDAELPSLSAPIEPRWSAELFDFPTMLVPRGEVLGISREHVYYRSPGHRGESVPARLLWYVSKGRSGPQGQMVIGCSRLDEVVIDEPDTLFSRFEHLGVYGREQVRAVAEPYGRAMALRFSDTELFPMPVPLGRFKALAESLGLPLSLISLSKISNALFQAVYEEGHRKT